jgi:hypothetical protein
MNMLGDKRLNPAGRLIACDDPYGSPMFRIPEEAVRGS